MKDIVPELLDKIERDFKERLNNNTNLSRIHRLINEGQATYKEANEYSVEAGEILADVFKKNISSSVLPDGKMYYNIANRTLQPTMKKLHESVSTVSADIQTGLNHSASLGIKGLKPSVNQDRIDGIINRVSGEEYYDDVSWMLDENVVNYSQSIVDDTIKVNSEFHAKSGLRPKIVRRSTGNCCDWCNSVAGTYEYPDVPKEVYRRHRYCKCTVDYYPGDGKKQNVHNKKWIDPEKDVKVEARKKVGMKYPFEESKTVKDANAFAEKMGFRADYSGIDIKCANEWNLGLYNSKNDFPEVAEQIKFVGASQKRYSHMKKEIEEYHYNSLIDKGYPQDISRKTAKKWANRDTSAFKVKDGNMASSFSPRFTEEQLQDPMFQIYDRYSGITMNNMYFNNHGKVVESGIIQVDKQWHPKGCHTVKATFDHEFAHQLDSYLNLRENESIKEIWETQTRESSKANLSEYAFGTYNTNGKFTEHANPGEMIAEAWSEYQNSEKPRELATRVGKDIEKLWKMKK